MSYINVILVKINIITSSIPVRILTRTVSHIVFCPKKCILIYPLLTHFELSEDIDYYSPVEHGLAVDRCDEVCNLLESQRGYLLHYLGRALQRVVFEDHNLSLVHMKIQ